MVTTRKSVVDKNAEINPDVVMEDVVPNEPSVAPTEGKSTDDSDYQEDDPTSHQDRVDTEDTTYVEEEEDYVRDGYYKDGYHY